MSTRRATPIVLLALAVIPFATFARAEEPTTAEEYLLRGHMWYRKGEWDKAIKDYTEVIRLAPKDPNGYFQRGCARGEKGETKEAIGDFTEVIRLDPKNASAFFGRGNAKLLAREFAKAIEDLDEAIRLDPKHALAFISRGSARSALGEYDDAIDDLTEAIRLNPKLGVAYRFRAIAWHHKVEFGKSNEDLTTAIKLDPKDAEAYAVRGMNYAAWPDGKCRDGKKAIEDAKKACELTGWKVGYPLESYAAACAEAGDFAEAVKWQKKAMDDPAYMKLRATQAREHLELYEAKKPFRLQIIPIGSPSTPR